MESEIERRSLTAWLPTYLQAQHFLRVIEGTKYSSFRAMRDAIDEQRGTPQSTVNWSNPDEWMLERLNDESQVLALRLWNESEQTVNPRDCRGLMSLGDTHNLVEYPDDTFVLTDRGKRFLAGDNKTLAEMDNYEGMLLILSEVAEKSPGKRRDFESRYAEFCLSLTTYAADSSISSSLIFRLNNLVDRDLVDRNGHTYQITDEGILYLQTNVSYTTHLLPSTREFHEMDLGTEPNTRSELRELAKRNNDEERTKLSNYLKSMHHYTFEKLIKHLLEEMSYEGVEVTSQTNDKGVDVVAEIELGISRVREVVQVKRQQNNVGRPTLDALRGSLHRFDAVRATIITTSGFTKNAKAAAFEKGVAPITLIDGERLLELLTEHDIGIRKREIRILEFDQENLAQLEAEIEPNLQSSALLVEEQ